MQSRTITKFQLKSDIRDLLPDREILGHENQMHKDTSSSWKYVQHTYINQQHMKYTLSTTSTTPASVGDE